MTTDAVQAFTAMLSLATLVAALLSLAALMVGGRTGWSRAVTAVIVDLGAWPVFVVTFGSMAGSLYFSEVADFAPCKLCWYQRIAMYSLAMISFVAAIRRDRAVTPYLVTLGGAGLVVSTYHYLLEWFPELEANVCSVDVPCTSVWFREFGFISLSFMAGTAFLATVTWALMLGRAWRSTPAG